MADQPDRGDETTARLWDLDQLHQLKARYFRLLDTQDWDAWAALFTDDATMQIDGSTTQPLRGRDAIVANVRAALVDAVTVHHGHMPELTITGPRGATGIWAMEDYVDMTAPDGSRVTFRGYGHYHEHYRREDDGSWRIAALHLTRLRIDPL